MDSIEDRRWTFDEVPELYERFRPNYPERLVEDVVWLAGLPVRGHILEIGCGTGKATLPFAARGHRMTCLEPGPRLAAFAQRKLAAFPDVRIEVVGFEQWPLETAGFDLVMAAQSFHFIDPAVALPKAAACLRPGGALAVFGNRPESGDSAVDRRVQEAYTRLAPTLSRRPDSDDPPLEDRIDATGLFESAVMIRYRWQGRFTSAEYTGLMETQSNHRLLPAEKRSALLAAIAQAIDGLGGVIVVDYVTTLHVARRRPGD